MDEFAEKIKDSGNVFQYEEESYHKADEYLNRDFEFLIVQLVREAYSQGRNTVTMDFLLKMNYWDIDYIRDEVTDTNDHWSVDSLVLDTLIWIIEDLRLGHVDSITLTHFSNAIDRIAENAVNAGYNARTSEDEIRFEIRELSMRYSSMINNLNLLKVRYDKQREEIFNQEKNRASEKGYQKDWRKRMEMAERIVELKKDIVRSPLIDLMTELPDLTEVAFTLNKKKMKELDVGINKFLNEFAQDSYIDDVPEYHHDRLNFAKQVENFCEYLTTLNLIGDTINVPFSILRDTSFEAVKILSHLKREGRISFDWTRKDYWPVTFSITPITPHSLLGLVTNVTKSSSAAQKTKHNLSFSKQPCSLTFIDQEGVKKKISIQGQVQKEVLRVIFRDENKCFDEWSLYDISEILGSEDVNERAVKNAIYQFNRKVQIRMPHIKRFFDLNQTSAKIDEQYVNKS